MIPSDSKELKNHYKKYNGNFDKFFTNSFSDIKTRDDKIHWIRLEVLAGSNGYAFLSDADVLKLTSNWKDYPALRTLVRTKMYWRFLTETHGIIPTRDRFEDSFILIEASYCSALVSCDNNLVTKHAKNINPYIDPINFNDLL
jgi:hypothetical protein